MNGKEREMFCDMIPSEEIFSSNIKSTAWDLVEFEVLHMQGLCIPFLDTCSFHTNTWPLHCLKICVRSSSSLYRITEFGSARPRPNTQPKMANLGVYQVGNFGANLPTIHTGIWDSTRTLDGFYTILNICERKPGQKFH